LYLSTPDPIPVYVQMVYFVSYKYINMYLYTVYVISNSRKVRMDTTRRGEGEEDERFLYM
jgi:hypothetical protein